MRIPALALIFSFLTLPCFGQIAPSGGSFFSDAPVFRMVMSENPIEWNPLFYYSANEAQLFTAVYEGLLNYHPQTQRPEAAAAESWEISKDLLTYTFHLRKNGQFSNGDPLTSRDFVNTWTRLLTLGDKAPFASLLDPVKGAREWRSGISRESDQLGFSTPDSHTLVITLNQPTGHFLQILCHQSMVPVHPSLLTIRSWENLEQIIGNGPFTFLKRDKNQVVFEKNPRYWDAEAVALQQIEVLFTDDLPTATAGFNSRRYQWLSGGAEFSLLGDKKSWVVSPQFATHFLFINSRIPALADRRVRRALGLLIDFAKLRDPAEYFIPTGKLIPSMPNYPNVKTMGERNQTEALKLLAEAGFPQGKGLPDLTVFLPEGEGSTRIAQLLEEAWSTLEANFEYRPWKGNDYNNLLQSDNYAVGTMSWIGDYPDPMTFLDLFAKGASLNIAGLDDSDFEALLAKSVTQQGVDRLKTLAKAEEVLLSTAACIPISHSPAVNVIDLDQVDGWYENPFDLHPFKTIRPKTPKPPRNIATIRQYAQQQL